MAIHLSLSPQGTTSRPSMVKSMLFVLCLLLMLMNILIVILTLIKADRNLTCTIFSGLLYYVTLTAFLWKFLFALQQSLFITSRLQLRWSNRTVFTVYVVVAFSLPLCPLILMFVKYPNSTFISSTCNFCWLTREFLLYGLLIPILAIVSLNFVLYVYTIVHLCLRNRQQSQLRSTLPDRSRQLQNFRIALFFATIMGLSWLLGFLTLIPNSYIQLFGNVLFCAVNACQGLVFSIMVFFMLERQAFDKYCCYCCHRPSRSKSASAPPRAVPDESDRRTAPSYNASIETASTSDGNHIYQTRLTPRVVKLPRDRHDEYIYSTPMF